MPLQDITITASISSIATQSYGLKTYIASTDEQSFPIEAITGSHAGAWPSFIPRGLNSTNSASNTTINLIVNVTQSWSGSNPTIYGYVPYVHNTMEEFFNGEFSGSEYVVTNGNLTDDFCEQFLEYDPNGLRYRIFPYAQQYNDIPPLTLIFSYLSAFLDEYTVPSPGQILMFYTDVYSGPGLTTRSTTINYLKIPRIDEDGNNNTLSLQGLEKIIWIDSSVGVIELDVTNITEYASYYLFEVTSPTYTNILYFADDNTLDYSFYATASSTPIILSSSYSSSGTYHYLTSSWDVLIDMDSGFNTSSGQYTFSLTPNIDIQFSSSMDITLTNPASLSIAINAYDPALPYSIPNAVDSYPAPLLSSVNTYVLSWGSTHSISISGANPPYPIQDYRYEVDFFITDLTGSGNNLHPYGPLVYAPPPDNKINNWSQFSLLSGDYLSTSNDYSQWLPWSTLASASDGGNSLWKQRIPNWTSVMYPTSSYNAGTIYYPADQYLAGYETSFPFGWTSYAFWEYYNPGPSQNGLVYALWNNYNGTSTFDPLLDASGLNNYLSSGSILTVTVPADTYPPILFTSSYQMGLSITIPPPFAGPLVNSQIIYGPPLDTVDIYVNIGDWNPSASYGYIGSLYSGAFGTFFFGPFTGSYNGNASNSETIFIIAPSSSRNASLDDGPSSPTYGLITGSAFMISSMSLFLWPQTASVHNLSFTITQSFLPTQSYTSSLIFEPYVYDNFYYSDCDVLINNFSQNDVSHLVQRVSYDEGSTIPSNLQQIISGTAERAELNDYIYTANANRLPRYEGVRTTSPGLNQPATEGGYGSTPNIESVQTYFAYFDFLQNTQPFLPGKAAAHIRYLINKDGEVQLPSISSSYYWNLIDNYSSNETTEILIQTNNETRETLGQKPIIRAGVYPKLILSNFKNSMNAYDRIYFKNDEFNIPKIDAYWDLSQDQIISPGEIEDLKFNYASADNDAIIIQNNLSDSTFKILESNNYTDVRVAITLKTNTNATFNYTIFVEKSLDSLNWEPYDQQFGTNNTFSMQSMTFFNLNLDKGTYYRFKILSHYSSTFDIRGGYNETNVLFFGSLGADGELIYTGSNWANFPPFPTYNPQVWEFGVDQFTKSYGPYWVTGSNKSVLTSSILYRYYDENNPFTQRVNPMSLYGGDSALPFNIKYGDIISFFQDDNLYTIKEVIADDIVDQGLLDSNFSNWFLTGTGWTINSTNNTVRSSGNNNGYIQKYFPPISFGDMIWVQFEISNFNPVTSPYGRIELGLSTNITNTTQDYIRYRTRIVRNGKANFIFKAYNVFPANHYLLIKPSTELTISNIKTSIMDSNSAKLFLKLDKDISSNTTISDINNFTISRYSSDPNYVLLDTPPLNDNGFLFPKYTTNELRQNFDNIATNLQKQGLI